MTKIGIGANFALCARRVDGRHSTNDNAMVGRFLVKDPGVCHGRLTFKGTRVPVETVLHGLGKGRSNEPLWHPNCGLGCRNSSEKVRCSSNLG